MTQNEHYVHAARILGWRFSAAHNGYINEHHRNPEDPSYAGYKVAHDCQHACFIDGIETIEAAMAFTMENA